LRRAFYHWQDTANEHRRGESRSISTIWLSVDCYRDWVGVDIVSVITAANNYQPATIFYSDAFGIDYKCAACISTD